MEKEKKEIKMSLWTFYVLMTAIVLLITALIIGGLKLYEKNNMPQATPQTEQIKEESKTKEAKTPNNQIPITNQNNNYIVLYDGLEIGKKYGRYDITNGMDVTNESIKKFNTKYYNYENGKYLGESQGVFGTEETTLYEGTSFVDNVKHFATTLKYDVMPRTFNVVNTIPDKIKSNIIDEYTSINIHSIDLDGDNKNEYVVCTVDESTRANGNQIIDSEIVLFDFEYNKVADLTCLRDDYSAQNSSEKILLNLEEYVTYADIDNDGIMEIIIETPEWEGRSVNIYKYNKGEIYGPTDFTISIQP